MNRRPTTWNRWLTKGLPLGLGLIFCGSALMARPHDSPENVARQLTRQMARQGNTPELLFRRATEYLALARLDLATKDLSLALRLDPEFIAARSELARVYLEKGCAEEVCNTLAPAFLATTNPTELAPLYLLRAQALSAQGQYDQALTNADRAVQLHPDPLDAYLIRSHILRQLGRPSEAAINLREGHLQTGSFVLEIEWIEALIDAGQHQTALEQLGPHLNAARWQGSWLLRRGRAKLGLGPQYEQAAVADLQAALHQINQRLDPNRPDLTLLAERGLAQALLGHRQEAEEDAKVLRRFRATPWLRQRLESALRDS